MKFQEISIQEMLSFNWRVIRKIYKLPEIFCKMWLECGKLTYSFKIVPETILQNNSHAQRVGKVRASGMGGNHGWVSTSNFKYFRLSGGEDLNKFSKKFEGILFRR